MNVLNEILGSIPTETLALIRAVTEGEMRRRGQMDLSSDMQSYEKILLLRGRKELVIKLYQLRMNWSEETTTKSVENYLLALDDLSKNEVEDKELNEEEIRRSWGKT